MKNLKEAEILDFILQEMIKNYNETKSNCFSVEYNNKLFYKIEKYEINKFDVNKLFGIIVNQTFNEDAIFKQNGNGGIIGCFGEPTLNTKRFIESGGYTNLYQIENLKLQKKIDKEDSDFKIAKNQSKLSRWQIFGFWIILAVPVITLIILIYNTYFKKP